VGCGLSKAHNPLGGSRVPPVMPNDLSRTDCSPSSATEMAGPSAYRRSNGDFPQVCVHLGDQTEGRARITRPGFPPAHHADPYRGGPNRCTARVYRWQGRLRRRERLRTVRHSRSAAQGKKPQTSSESSSRSKAAYGRRRPERQRRPLRPARSSLRPFPHRRSPARGVAKISKVLHLKCPGLFPILDSKVLLASCSFRRCPIPHRGRRAMFWAAIRDDVCTNFDSGALSLFRRHLA
jgi:hypothetical protein